MHSLSSDDHQVWTDDDVYVVYHRYCSVHATRMKSGATREHSTSASFSSFWAAAAADAFSVLPAQPDHHQCIQSDPHNMTTNTTLYSVPIRYYNVQQPHSLIINTAHRWWWWQCTLFVCSFSFFCNNTTRQSLANDESQWDYHHHHQRPSFRGISTVVNHQNTGL